MFTRYKFLLPTAIASIFPMLVTAAPVEGVSEETTIPKMRSMNEEGYRPHIGALAGYASARDDGIKEDGSFGIEIGFQPIYPFGLSAQWQYTPGRLDVPGPKTSFNVSNLLLKGVLNFSGTIPIIRDSYLGAKSGAVLNSLEGENTAKFAVGPVVGFDIPLDPNEQLTLGAEISYLGIIGENTPDPYSALGAMKYWF